MGRLGETDINALRFLSALGGSGAHPQNMHRALVARLNLCEMPPPFDFRIALNTSGIARDVQQSALLPHVIFATLYTHACGVLWCVCCAW